MSELKTTTLVTAQPLHRYPWATAVALTQQDGTVRLFEIVSDSVQRPDGTWETEIKG